MHNQSTISRNLKHMHDNVRRTVNSLELCWGCDKICECEPWLSTDGYLWLCIECFSELSCQLEKDAGPQAALLPA